MTTEKITVGKIVAKLRNTVPVCLLVDGAEVKRYKNIEFPDEMKTLEASAFGFVIRDGGKIEFHLNFDAGVLPEEFPANRKSVSWAEQKAAKAETVNTEDLAAAATEVISAFTGSEVTVEAVEPAAESELPLYEPVIKHSEATEPHRRWRFGVTGADRKALVVAIAEAIGQQPEYLGAPSFTYAIGELRVDKTGTLTGEVGQELIDTLAERGFVAADAA